MERACTRVTSLNWLASWTEAGSWPPAMSGERMSRQKDSIRPYLELSSQHIHMEI